MSETWIPILIAFAIMGVFLGFFYFNSLTKRSLHSALEKALDKGEKLTPELLKILQTPSRGKFGDLRKGILWLAFGLAAVLGTTFSAENHDHNLVFIALLPVFIGLGYVLIWKLNPDDDGK